MRWSLDATQHCECHQGFHKLYKCSDVSPIEYQVQIVLYLLAWYDSCRYGFHQWAARCIPGACGGKLHLFHNCAGTLCSTQLYTDSCNCAENTPPHKNMPVEFCYSVFIEIFTMQATRGDLWVCVCMYARDVCGFVCRYVCVCVLPHISSRVIEAWL